MEESFGTQVGVSAAGNILCLFVGLLVWFIKVRCAKSRCRSHFHCPCCDLDVRDQTIRSDPDSSRRLPEPPETSESVRLDVQPASD